ncbi:MAG: hypothetical protein M0Z92_14500 [Actinomycetota bacterium]|nr:hypothetical protein [Actinomycetota bacterium]
MIDLPLVPEFGPLEFGETLVFYDIPRVFTCRDAVGTPILVVWADESEIGDGWFYVRASRARIRDVKSGAMALRSAVVEPEQTTYLVMTLNDGNVEVRQLTPGDLAALEDDLLPAEDFRFNLLDDDRSEQDLRDPSLQGRVDIDGRALLELAFHLGQVPGEAPVTLVAQTLEHLQTTLTNIGFASFRAEKGLDPPLTRGKVDDEVSREMAGILLGSGSPGSFKLTVASPDFGNLFGDARFGSAARRLTSLLDPALDDESLSRDLESIGVRAASSFLDLVDQLAKPSCDITLAFGSPWTTASSRRIQRQRLRDFRERLNRATPSQQTVEDSFRLYMIDSDKWEVGLATVDGTRKLKASVNEDIQDLVTSLRVESVYRIRLSETIERNAFTGKESSRLVVLNMDETTPTL